MTKKVAWSIEHALVSHDDFALDFDRLQHEIARCKTHLQREKLCYTSPYDFLSLVYDTESISAVQKLALEKLRLNPTLLIVIGIGGSSLGARALYQALFGSYYNELANGLRIYFAETIDTDETYELVLLMQQELEKGNAVLLNVISKSGTTLETIVNFDVFALLLRNAFDEEYHHYIVVTTHDGSLLWNIAQKEGFARLSIPLSVGGRYSVFSPVGLFPLAMMGVDIEKLLKGAQDIIGSCVSNDLNENPAASRALVLYNLYNKGFTIHDMFIFATDLHNFGLWYRQLMGESIAKQHTLSGEQVFIGITPTVSLATVDLHSVAQLYLGGPFDKITTFVSVKNQKTDISFSNNQFIKILGLSQLQSTKFTHIMNAILQGTQTAYKKNQRPFMAFELDAKDPYCLGKLLQICMIEMVYLAYLLGVNPFDQPEVERYKKEVRVLL